MTRKRRILVLVGKRPETVERAPVVHALKPAGAQTRVHAAMATVRNPCGDGTTSAQIAAVLRRDLAV